MKYDIKKLTLSLLTFVIVAVAFTATAIVTKNNSNNGKDDGGNKSNNDNNVTEVSISSDENAGTKRNQKYNQNDLEIIETVNNGTDVLYSSTSVRVSGLKNKEIENRINNELANAEQSVRNTFESEKEAGDTLSIVMRVERKFL